MIAGTKPRYRPPKRTSRKSDDPAWTAAITDKYTSPEAVAAERRRRENATRIHHAREAGRGWLWVMLRKLADRAVERRARQAL